MQSYPTTRRQVLCRLFESFCETLFRYYNGTTDVVAPGFGTEHGWFFDLTKGEFRELSGPPNFYHGVLKAVWYTDIYQVAMLMQTPVTI